MATKNTRPVFGAIPSDDKNENNVGVVSAPVKKRFRETVPITYVSPTQKSRVILNMQPSPEDPRDKVFVRRKRHFRKQRMQRVGERIIGNVNPVTDNQFMGEPNEELPEKLDYTSQMMPVRNQGDLFGTCGPQVFCSMYEWKEKRVCGHLSPQFMFNCRATQNQNGMTCRDVMKIGQKIGVPKDTEYPYGTKGDMVDIARDSELMHAASRHKISSYARVYSIEDMKAALVANGPGMVAVPVYNLTDANKLWVKDENNSRLQGGHAVTLVGYDTDEIGPHFIVRNSWGVAWGDKGYGKLYEKDWERVWEGWTCEYIGHSGEEAIAPVDSEKHNCEGGVCKPDPSETICDKFANSVKKCF